MLANFRGSTVINGLLKARMHGSILERLWRLAAGAAASYPRRRRLRLRRLRLRRRRRRRRRGIILLRLLRLLRRLLLLVLVLRIVIAETLSTKRKSGTATENE